MNYEDEIKKLQNEIALLKRKNKHDDHSVFSKNLDLLMFEKNITQAELAKKVGCTRQAISSYIQDLTLPNIDMLCKIADCFNVSTDYLLGRTENKES